MTSGADLFVVCKQCGSEVSPYVTECPYCGNRLRRRAPKLPRVNGPSHPAPTRGGLGGLLSRSRRPGAPARALGSSRGGGGRWEATRPYATIALVVVSCVAWVAARAEPNVYLHTAVAGPLGGEWWKLLSNGLVYYFHGLYVFVCVAALAIFGWLFERRHGSVVTLALFFGAAAAGALAAIAVYAVPVVSGADGAALALLAGWAAPDLLASTTRATCWARVRWRCCCWRCRSRMRSRKRAGLRAWWPARSACWLAWALGVAAWRMDRAPMMVGV
jgi:hypothetical protein